MKKTKLANYAVDGLGLIAKGATTVGTYLGADGLYKGNDVEAMVGGGILLGGAGLNYVHGLLEKAVKGEKMSALKNCTIGTAVGIGLGMGAFGLGEAVQEMGAVNK